jgi:hypothetical protein
MLDARGCTQPLARCRQGNYGADGTVAGLDPQAIDLEPYIGRGRLMKNAATPREFVQADGRHDRAVREGLVVNPVDTGGRVVQQGGALGRGVACGQPFEGVVHDIVRV